MLLGEQSVNKASVSYFNYIVFEFIGETAYSFCFSSFLVEKKDYFIFIEKAKYNCNINP